MRMSSEWRSVDRAAREQTQSSMRFRPGSQMFARGEGRSVCRWTARDAPHRSATSARLRMLGATDSAQWRQQKEAPTGEPNPESSSAEEKPPTESRLRQKSPRRFLEPDHQASSLQKRRGQEPRRKATARDSPASIRPTSHPPLHRSVCALTRCRSSSTRSLPRANNPYGGCPRQSFRPLRHGERRSVRCLTPRARHAAAETARWSIRCRSRARFSVSLFTAAGCARAHAPGSIPPHQLRPTGTEGRRR